MKALLLAAGIGSRLRPLTLDWPKCLMPIIGRPLLEYWLCMLQKNGISDTLVNVHHHRPLVEEFLRRACFRNWVSSTYEPVLLGTAGTLLKNLAQFRNQSTLLIHADNWCQCDFSEFLRFHVEERPNDTVMTMMTFRTESPESCGIVELNDLGVIVGYHEKIPDPPGDLANGAVYILEPEILDWLDQHPLNTDFSTQVIPYFVGRIATWENTGIHRDIGTVESLLSAQFDPQPDLCWPENDNWQARFKHNAVNNLLMSMNL